MIKSIQYPTREEILSDLRYEPDSGKFFWNKSKRGRSLHKEAGGIDNDGYRRIFINGKKCFAHRLAYIVIHGSIPAHTLIDHINNLPGDNSIENLRIADKSKNNYNSRRPKNNTSGVKGVSWRKDCQKWCVKISYQNKEHFFGFFTDIKEAEQVAIKARQSLHGEFARVS